MSYFAQKRQAATSVGPEYLMNRSCLRETGVDYSKLVSATTKTLSFSVSLSPVDQIVWVAWSYLRLDHDLYLICGFSFCNSSLYSSEFTIGLEWGV